MHVDYWIVRWTEVLCVCIPRMNFFWLMLLLSVNVTSVYDFKYRIVAVCACSTVVLLLLRDTMYLAALVYSGIIGFGGYFQSWWRVLSVFYILTVESILNCIFCPHWNQERARHENKRPYDKYTAHSTGKSRLQHHIQEDERKHMKTENQ
jgi:hypothetical protein